MRKKQSIPSKMANERKNEEENRVKKITLNYSIFVLNFYSGRGFCYFIGISEFLLKCSDSYMLPGSICSAANTPTTARAPWLNCSSFGNWVSQLWCSNSVVQFALPEKASGTHNSSIHSSVPSFLNRGQQWI